MYLWLVIGRRRRKVNDSVAPVAVAVAVVVPFKATRVGRIIRYNHKGFSLLFGDLTTAWMKIKGLTRTRCGN